MAQEDVEGDLVGMRRCSTGLVDGEDLGDQQRLACGREGVRT